MNCPHCGAEWKGWRGMWDCDSFPSGKDGSVKRTDACFERQIAQLKSELSQCKDSIEKRGFAWSNMKEDIEANWREKLVHALIERDEARKALSQCVRRDDPRLQESVMCAWKIMERISVQERAACAHTIKSNIQTIIEGK